jgi:hypothetical protein
VLAHSSGEWVSSEWPVCPITDTASPQRMGAALTYARRYALFTLVGIAGEDDLDAPELTHGTGQATASNGQSKPSQDAGSAPGHSNGSARKPVRPAKPILAPEASAALRAQLMTELEVITASEAAIAWAYNRLPVKNTLVADDARIIENAFQAKMTALSVDQKDGTSVAATVRGSVGDRTFETAEQTNSPDLTRQVPELPNTKGTVPLKPQRRRDKRHREFVAAQACLVCGGKPSDAHHLRFAQPRALGRKVSDEFTVPLCREHHRELHRRGDEVRWWKDEGIDAIAIARSLWLQTQTYGWASSSPSLDPARS